MSLHIMYKKENLGQHLTGRKVISIFIRQFVTTTTHVCVFHTFLLRDQISNQIHLHQISVFCISSQNI